MTSWWTSGRRRRGWSGAEGFSLLEVVVAMTLLLALVPLLGSISGGLRSEEQVAHHLEAVALAEARMSQITLLPADSLQGYMEARDGYFPPPFQNYAWRALVRPAPGAPGLLRCAVLVEGNGRRFSLETLLHRPELLARGGGGAP